jgi:hypothetical protein
LIEKCFLIFINFIWLLIKAIISVPYYILVMLAAGLGWLKEVLPTKIKNVSDVMSVNGI